MAKPLRARSATGTVSAEGGPQPVDVYVGGRVRMRRTLLGMSQEKLGRAVGLTFAQIQKYECGVNRVGASRLFDLSRILDVPVSFFFEDLPANFARRRARRAGGLVEAPAPFEHDPLSKRETLELVRAYYGVTDRRVRKRVLDLIKSLAKAS
ncbi:MAG: helix-turn-helix domain-containing protein [Terriglobia bacterium]